MLQAYFRSLLDPYREQIASLLTAVEDLQRRAENHNRIGTIKEVDAAKGLVKVSHGDNLSPWIKFMMPAAGEVRETRIPSVDEQTLLINFSGGDGSAHAVALCGLPCDKYPIVSDKGELHRKVYPDGTEQSYDHAAHALDWKNGPTTVKADQSSIELMCGASGIKINAEGVQLIGLMIKHGEVNIGATHTHKDTMPYPNGVSGMVTP